MPGCDKLYDLVLFSPVLIVDLVAVAGRVDDVEPQLDAILHDD